MSRRENLERIAENTENLVREFGRRQDITITYTELDDKNITEFSDWDRRYNGLHTGDERFFIWEPNETKDGFHLLYSVNVSADSLLTAAWELMDLVSCKF